MGKFDNRNKKNNDDLAEELEDDVEELSNDIPEEEEEDDTPEDTPQDDKNDNDLDEKLEEEEEDDDIDDDNENNENEEEEDDTPEDTPQDDKNDNDLDEKLAASQRESLVQNARNKQLTEKIRQAQSLDVTEEELRTEATKEGLDFDTLDQFQKSMLKRAIISERKFNTVSEVVIEDDKITEWGKKVDEFIENEDNLNKYPKLQNNTEKFKTFCMKQTRRGMEFEDLVAGFLYNLPNQKSKKGSLLLRSTKGGQKPKKKELTADDVKALRQHSPNKYMRLVKAGKIKIDI